MVRLYDALQAVRFDLDTMEVINKTKWDLMCAEKITADRCQASFFWRVLIEAGVFRPINGKAWQINHEKMLDVITRNNPGNGVEA